MCVSGFVVVVVTVGSLTKVTLSIKFKDVLRECGSFTSPSARSLPSLDYEDVRFRNWSS